MSTEPTPIEEFDLYEARPLPKLNSLFNEYRGACPVGRSEQNGGFWMATSYDAVHAIARDEETFSNRQGIVIPPIDARIGLIYYDPPEHTKYRGPLQAWLSAANMRRFEAPAREFARSYLAELTSPCDFVGDYALPYALEVITTVLGVPADTRPAMTAMMRTFLSEAGNDLSKAAGAVEMFSMYAKQALIAPRREMGPTDDPSDVIDLLVGAEVDGRGLNDDEISELVLAVLNAGFETTYKGLSASLWYLSQRPEAWKALKTGDLDLNIAVEELLRFVAPVSVGRTATRDVVVDGAEIKAGESVLMCLHGANRDEKYFDEPNELVLDRAPNRHLTFGTGIHRCIGMHLARLELQVAIGQAVAAFDEIWMPEGTEPTFEGTQAAGLTALPMAFTRTS